MGGILWVDTADNINDADISDTIIVRFYCSALGIIAKVKVRVKLDLS